MNFTYSGSEPQPSLAWQFQNSNVDYVTNLTPSAQVSPGPAQLQGSAALVTNAPTSNTAVSFPGTTGAYMDLGASSSTNINQNTSNIFIEAWVYFNSLSVGNRIFTRAPNTVSGAGTVDIVFRTSGTTLYFNYGTGGIAGGANGPSALTTGRWYHVAISSVVGGGNSYCFIDGVPGAGIVIAQDTYNASYTSIIGAGSSEYSNMYIRDLRVVQGGVVPVATFTPGAAPFSYAKPTYVANMGTTVFTLLGQFITYVPGKFGSAIKLTNPVNADTEYISYPIPTIRIEEAGFSCACWVNFQALPPSNYQGYFLNFYGSTSTGLALNLPTIYALLDYATSKIVLVYYVANNTFMIPTDYVVSLNTWYHFAFTIYGGYVRMYINGTQTTNPRTYDATTYANLNINTRFNLGNSVLGGYSVSFTIDDLRIYNSALTSTQVQSVYSSQGAPAPSRAMPLPKLAWDFNGTTAPYIGSATATITGTETYGNGINKQGIVISNPAGTAINYVKWDISSQFYINNGFTYSVWVNFTDLSLLSTSPVIMAIRGSVYSSTIAYRLTTGGAILSLYWQDPSTYKDITGPIVTANKWYNFSTVFINGNVSLYVNGVTVGTSTYDPYYNVALNTSITVGSFTNPGTPFIGGIIDDLRIFDRALTSAQVQAIYNQQGVPGRGAVTVNSYIANGLVAYYDTQNLRYPNSVSGTTWYDISGNGRSVTIRPGSSYNSTGKYITFDGTVNSGTTVAESGQSLTKWTVMCAFMQTARGTGFARVAGASPNIDAGEIALNNQTLAFNSPESGTWTYTSFTTTYNVWYHMCISFDTTTTGAVDVWVYINGALVNSYTIDGTVETLTGYTIGTRNNFNNECMIGRMSLFAIYNKVLSQSEVTANYEVYKKTQIPTYSPARLTGTPLFSQLSSAATSSAVGAFSLRAVNGLSPSGTAKAVQVRNGTTSAVQDFYADRLGNLLTAPVVGQPLANWLGGATGYVTTWYDQSGKGNHASQATAANQPVIQKATKGPGYSCLFNGANSQVLSCAAGTYSLLNGTKYAVCVTERRNNSATTGGYFGLGSTGASGTGLIIGYFGSDTNIVYTHRGDNLDNTVPAFAGAYEPMRYTVYDYSTSTTKRVYINASVLPVTNTSYDLAATTGAMTIGKSFGTSNSTYYYGEIYELLVFTQSLYDLDTSGGLITQIYNNQVAAYGA